jgi:hypothetical protein
LEDSFLPGALQNPAIVTFHSNSYSTRIREMTPLPSYIINTSYHSVD